MKLYTAYISLIFLVKIIYFIFALLIIYYTKKNNEELKEIFTYWKHHIEFLFIALMSLLLIILFNPFYNGLKLIDYETKLLLFVYGIIIIIGAQWSLFFKESMVFKILNNQD
jgi:hypothetical protein